MKPNSNTIFIILSALVVAGGAYAYLSGTKTELPLSVSVEQNVKQVEFQALLTQLPDDFDTSIFSDEKFLSLRDLKTEVIDESRGRLDPFAPVSGVGAP